MNVHVPQSLLARAEAEQLMTSVKVIMLPAKGSPCMGLVQDALLGAFVMSRRDAFFDRAELYELLMHASSGACHIDVSRVPPPCILRPRHLWSGKQILSMVLPHSIQVPPRDAATAKAARDDELIVIDGRLLAGRLNKSSVGVASGSFVHQLCADVSVGEEERDRRVRSFFDGLEFMCKEVHTMRGFSVGIDDMIFGCRRNTSVDGHCLRRRQRRAPTTTPDVCVGCQHTVHTETVKRTVMHEMTRFIAADRRTPLAQNVPFDVAMDQKISSRERRLISMQDRVRDDLGKYALDALAQRNARNNVMQMMQAGSKGNHINLSQMTVCVGGQTIKGHRVADTDYQRGIPRPIETLVGGIASHSLASRALADGRYRTSAHFSRGYPGPLSGGFVASSFIEGLSPSEFVAHARGGREGIIDKALNTQDSGYLQRRSMKACEDLRVAYDGTVRNANDRIVQFTYGIGGAHVERKELDAIELADVDIARRFSWLHSVDLADSAVLREEMARIWCAIRRLRVLTAGDGTTTTLYTANNIARILRAIPRAERMRCVSRTSIERVVVECGRVVEADAPSDSGGGDG